ncbi:hypothetical protein WMF39_40300 [Sorangium sp. So ce1504]|uniref:hypothetical protein n=1 Tax=Sorangium sp. So ce1504 TaxID=3133337 RepID=UPI003F5EA56A
MFTAIASSQQPIRLHRLQGAIIASTGPYIARAQGGQLHEQRKTEVVRAPNAQGVVPEAIVPDEIVGMVGRWPDCTWASAIGVGWTIRMGSRRLRPAEAIVLAEELKKPRGAAVRWDERHARWVEHPDVLWVLQWAGGVLGLEADGTLRWLDSSDKPIPPVLAKKIVWDGWYPPAHFHRTTAGDVAVHIVRARHHQPEWWMFPRGEEHGERLEWPPGVDESGIEMVAGYPPYESMAIGELESGEPFLAYRAQGRWLPLPPVSREFRVISLAATPRGELFLFSENASSALYIHRLARGGEWERVPIPFHTTLQVGHERSFVASEDDELWLAIDFGNSTQHEAVLYHACS